MTAKKKNKKQAQVNPELTGYDVSVNNFGEINSTLDIDTINNFLNKNVEDKKLKDRDDLSKS